jgi:hypothetical protein
LVYFTGKNLATLTRTRKFAILKKPEFMEVVRVRFKNSGKVFRAIQVVSFF